jgi:hypothetical protein
MFYDSYFMQVIINIKNQYAQQQIMAVFCNQVHDTDITVGSSGS